MSRVMAVSETTFGRGSCCWKPQGCTMTEEHGCRLMRHPVKRAMLLNDPEAPCPNGWVVDDRPQTCALLYGHAGDCQAVA
jgi:hypothetical protein